MINLNDKRAGERYLTPWLFLVWAIIGVGIVAGVIMFYSATIDVRAEEADILAVRVADCVIDRGHIKDEFFNNFDVFSECSLDKESIENKELYFIDLGVYDASGNELTNFGIEKGVLSWKELCMMQKEKIYKNFPQCAEKEISAFNQSDSEFTIKILTASNQLGGSI